jgi:hypothetical protein
MLPSASSALAFVQGQPGSFLPVVGHTLARAGLIGVGLALAGQKEHLVRSAIMGSLSIEAFVLFWANYQVNQMRQGAAQGFR